jgi:hypothetical protein
MTEADKFSFVPRWLARDCPQGDLVAAVVWDRVSLWLAAYKEQREGYALDLDCAYALASQFDRERGLAHG